jgi:hypothetical protein
MARKHPFSLCPSCHYMTDSLALQGASSWERWSVYVTLDSGQIVTFVVNGMRRVDPNSIDEWEFDGVVVAGHRKESPGADLPIGTRIKGRMNTKARSGTLWNADSVFILETPVTIRTILDDAFGGQIYGFFLNGDEKSRLGISIQGIQRRDVPGCQWILVGYVNSTSGACVRLGVPISMVLVKCDSATPFGTITNARLIEAPFNAVSGLGQFFPSEAR